MDRIEKKKKEKEFQDFFLFSSILNLKRGMWVTLVLFIAFRYITIFFFHDSETNLYFLRFGIIIPLIIVTLLVLYIRAFRPWLHSILTIIVLLSSIGIFFVGATSDIHRPGYQYYPIWVMLVIMGTFVFYRITYRNLLIIGGISILSFIMANIYNHFLRDEPMMFTVNLFFVIAMGSLGYFISAYRNKNIREIFMKEKESLDHNKKLMHEVQERIKAQNELLESQKISIELKEILLREIHHRVKNNLAIVISLLDMQVRKNPNPEFIKLSHDIEHRIRSMALIHEHLYTSENFDRVPVDKYIIAITNGITRTYGSENIKTLFNVELVDVKIEIAMPLGLIANEILTNAFKYAFPDRRQGEIKIDLKGEEPTSDMYRLRITDNGIGLPDGFSIDEQSSMGMLIIQLLVDQIGARLVIDNHQGTSFSIIFKGIETQKQNK